MGDQDFHVAIVGSGPVGMVLALDLAARGVSTVLIERDRSPHQHPKGNTHNARTMEHYRRLGLADRVRALGLPAARPTDVVYLSRFGGYELARHRMPSTAGKVTAPHQVTDQVPEPIHRANQMYVERLLHERVLAAPAVTALYGTEFTGCTERADGVSVGLRDVVTAQPSTVDCGYLVGCDGARSTVRGLLGARLTGEWGFATASYMGGPMCSTRVRVPGIAKYVAAAPGWQYRIMNGRSLNFISLDGGDEYLFHATGEAGSNRAGDVRELIAACARTGDLEAEVISAREWTAGRALVSERYGSGRILLCGDAAHVFTPTGGFGMNTGIDDAANLAWKLAAVVRGWGGPRLLASYESERRPIGSRNTRAAHGIARRMCNLRLDKALDADGSAGDAARARLAGQLAGFAEEYCSLGVQLGARYDSSPVIAGDRRPPPPDRPERYVPSAVPGGRAPHLWFPDGSSLFDRFGPGFTVLRLGGSGGQNLDDDVARLTATACGLRVPLRVVEVPGEAGHDLYGCDLALVRPDQHVAWSGNGLADPEALLRRVTGRPCGR